MAVMNDGSEIEAASVPLFVAAEDSSPGANFISISYSPISSVRSRTRSPHAVLQCRGCAALHRDVLAAHFPVVIGCLRRVFCGALD